MKSTNLILLCALALTGCANSTMFENRLMRDLDCEQVVISSKWLGFAFEFDLAKKDAKAVCQQSQTK